MDDGYFAAWSGRTIQYISDNIGSSLEPHPNVILLAAGTDATILVAMIINTCDEDESPRTKEFQKLIPGVVKSRKDDGKHVLAVDFTSFSTSDLQDCIHPTNNGYKIVGDYCYSFISQIPKGWIKDPEGSDPSRDDDAGGANGGIDKNIPAPNWDKSPIQVTSKETVANTIDWATGGQKRSASCPDNPQWKGAGQIAIDGVGHNGDWKYKKNWIEQGEVASGLGLENRHVRLHDMNGDGKADYVLADPKKGEIRCWLNNLPEPWLPAGNNNSIIGSGAGPSKTVYLADMNADGIGYPSISEQHDS